MKKITKITIFALLVLLAGCAGGDLIEFVEVEQPTQTSFSVQRNWQAVVGKTTITDTVRKVVDDNVVEIQEVSWVFETKDLGNVGVDPTTEKIMVSRLQGTDNFIVDLGSSAFINVEMTYPTNPFEGEWEMAELKNLHYEGFELINRTEEVLSHEVVVTTEVKLNFSIVMSKYEPLEVPFYFHLTGITSSETDYLKGFEVENITWYTFDLIEDFNLTGKKTTNYVATPKPEFSRLDIPTTYLVVESLDDAKISTPGATIDNMTRELGNVSTNGNWSYTNYTEKWTVGNYPEWTLIYNGQHATYTKDPYPHVELAYRELSPKHNGTTVTYKETYVYQGKEYHAKVRKDTFEDALGQFTKETVFLMEKPVDEVNYKVTNVTVTGDKLSFDIEETHSVKTELNKVEKAEISLSFDINVDGPVTISSRDSSLPGLVTKKSISFGGDDYDHDKFVAHVTYNVTKSYKYNHKGIELIVNLPEGTVVETMEGTTSFIEKDSSNPEMDLYKYQITYNLAINSNIVATTNYGANIRVWRNNLDTFGVDKNEKFMGAVATVILNTSTRKTHTCLMLEFSECMVAIIDGNKTNAMVFDTKENVYGKYNSVVYNNGNWEAAVAMEDSNGIAYKGNNRIVTVTTADGIVFNYPTSGNNITCFIATNIASDLNRHEVKFNGNTIVVID